MKLITGSGFNKLAGMVDQFVGADVGLNKVLGDCELSIGLATEAGFGVPAHAADSAIFMGDEVFKGDKIITAAQEAMLLSLIHI